MMNVEVVKLHELGDNNEIWIPFHSIRFIRRDKCGGANGSRLYIGSNPQNFIYIAETPEGVMEALGLEEVKDVPEPEPQPKPSAWQRFLNSWRKQNGSERNTET